MYGTVRYNPLKAEDDFQKNDVFMLHSTGTLVQVLVLYL